MPRLWLPALVFVSVALPSVANADEAPAAPATALPAASTAPPAAPSAPPTAPPALAAAPAAPTASDDAADLARFSAFTAEGDRPTRIYHYIGALAGLGVGGLVLPVGVVMHSRDPQASTGIVIGVGAAALLEGTILLLGELSSPYRRAALAVEQAKAGGRRDGEALAAGEAVLQNAADDERLERRVGGGIFLGLGLSALGVGTAFAAADFTGRDFSRREQDGVASALLVGGALATAGALQALFFPSPIEQAWAGYRAGKRHAAPIAPESCGLGVAPVAGGASFALTGRF